MTLYPVMFTFKDVVSGNGFLAGITLCGRALMCREDDVKWWTYGVHPGGMAEVGEAALESFSNFRNSYKKILFDIAEEAANFEAFKREVERFYAECAEGEEERWDTAAKAFRSGEVQPEEPFSKLPKRDPEKHPVEIEVVRLDKLESNRFSTNFNVPDKL